MLDLSSEDFYKLPILDVDYNSIDCWLKNKREWIGDHFEDFVDIDKGSLGSFSWFSYHQYDKDHILFDYELIGRSWNGLEIFYIVKPNKIKKYKIYFSSFLKVINIRILKTLAIWELIDYEVGAYAVWTDLKIWKWLKKNVNLLY